MDIDVVQVENQSVAFIRRIVPMDSLPQLFDEAFGAIAEAVAGAGGSIVGVPFGWYHGMPSDTVDVAAGFPVSGLPAGSVGGGEVMVEERVGGQAVVAMHVGPYDTMVDSYAAIEAHMQEHGLTPRDDMWEEYLTDPGAEPDQSKWETRITWPTR